MNRTFLIGLLADAAIERVQALIAEVTGGKPCMI